MLDKCVLYCGLCFRKFNGVYKSSAVRRHLLNINLPKIKSRSAGGNISCLYLCFTRKYFVLLRFGKMLIWKKTVMFNLSMRESIASSLEVV